MYNPGTHIIATIKTSAAAKLDKYALFEELTGNLVNRFALQKLGEVYHNFTPAGFTAVICLSESHISVHTWPEHEMLNIDIYLSNFERNNDGTVKEIFDNYLQFFEGTIVHSQTIVR